MGVNGGEYAGGFGLRGNSSGGLRCCHPNLLYYSGWRLFRLVFRIAFRWRVFHPERIPASGPVLIASNHASFLDPPLVGSACNRDLYYLARDTLFATDFSRWVLKRCQTVPVDREGGGASGLKAVLQLLANQQAVLLFPEGTRTRDGGLQPVRSGIGMIAMKAQAPVVPARVFGTFEVLGRHARLPRLRRVAVKFGYPLELSRWQEELANAQKARQKEIYQAVAEEIMRAIGRLEPSLDKGVFP